MRKDCERCVCYQADKIMRQFLKTFPECPRYMKYRVVIWNNCPFTYTSSVQGRKTVESVMSHMGSSPEAVQQVRTDNSQEGRWVHSASSTSEPKKHAVCTLWCLIICKEEGQKFLFHLKTARLHAVFHFNSFF